MCKRKSWMSKVRPGQGQGGRDGETEARRRNGAASAPWKELVALCPSATSFPLGARLPVPQGDGASPVPPGAGRDWDKTPPLCVLLQHHPARPRTGCLPARASGREIHSPGVICLLFFQETHSELISSRASAGSVGSIPVLHPPARPSAPQRRGRGHRGAHLGTCPMGVLPPGHLAPPKRPCARQLGAGSWPLPFVTHLGRAGAGMGF